MLAALGTGLPPALLAAETRTPALQLCTEGSKTFPSVLATLLPGHLLDSKCLDVIVKTVGMVEA